jgi:hypothetical protein
VHLYVVLTRHAGINQSINQSIAVLFDIFDRHGTGYWKKSAIAVFIGDRPLPKEIADHLLKVWRPAYVWASSFKATG